MRTLAIRLEDDLHAQLGMIAKLEELTVTDAIRQAIEQWIEEKRTNPGLQARAEAVLADIMRDAEIRRGAIEALLGGVDPEPTVKTRRGRPPKDGDGDASE